MRRVNTFDVCPHSRRDKLALIELLDASTACWNQVQYARRQAFLNRKESEGNATVSQLKQAVKKTATQEEYRQKYIQQLSSSIPQQLVQKNWQTWDGFFELLKKYRNPEDDSVTDRPGLPGYWKEDGVRTLHTLLRNDTYTLSLGKRSRLRIPLGKELKEKYGIGYHEKLTLEVRGRPHWEGKQGRLELVYDRETESFTAHQSVGNDTHTPSRRTSTHSHLLATTDGEDVVAAVDIGANNLAACTTSRGDHCLFHGRPCFEDFHAYTREISRLQAMLPDGRYSSKRIREVYRKRSVKRDHAMDALIQHLAEWLAEHNVTELIVGDLSDVLKTHWSARVNEKNHLFWAHGRFRRRLHEVVEAEYGIMVHEKSEANTSSRCPHCGAENVHRSGDLLQCRTCGVEAHADVAGSMNFLVTETAVEYRDLNQGGSMARPAAPGQNRLGDAVACFEWDDHCWRQRDHSTKEEPANHTRQGKFPSGDPGTA